MRHLSWETYEQDLTAIVEKYKSEAKERTVGRPNGNGHMSVYSGEIEIRKDHTMHGGTYGFNRYCPTVITVGSNVDRDTAKAIASEYEEVISEYLELGNLTINDSKVYDCQKYGTSFSTYGIGN